MATDTDRSTEAEGPAPAPPRATRPEPVRLRPSAKHYALSVAIATVVAALAAVVMQWVIDAEEPADPVRTADLSPANPAPVTPFEKLGGGEASLADYAGTPLVVNFFAETCVPCRKEMPDLQRIHQEVGDRVTVLGIDHGDTEEVAAAFATEMGVTYPLGRDASGELARAFGIDYLPGTAFITRQGDIVGVHRGQLSYDELRDLVDQYLQ